MTPFQKLGAAIGGVGKGDASDTFTLFLGEAVVDVTLVPGEPQLLVLRAHEEEAAPSSGFRRNVLARTRARQVYPTLAVRRVTPLDRVNRLFAFRFDVRTGDAKFDDAVTIEGDFSDEVIANALRSSEAREAILAILDAGFTVHFEERAVRADLRSPTDAFLNAATVNPVAEALGKLVMTVPRSDPAVFTARPQLGRALVGVILGTGLMAALTLAPGTLDDSAVQLRPLPRPLVALPQMLPGILLGTGLFVVAYLIIRAILKRRNTWTDLPVVMALLVAMWTLGVGLLDAGNRLLDDAELEVHDTKILAKDVSKSRKSGNVTEWLLVIPSWKPNAKEVELSVDVDLHRRVRAGDTLRLSVHPGFFGWPWGAVVERAGGAAPGTDRIPGLLPPDIEPLPSADPSSTEPSRDAPNRAPRPDTTAAPEAP